MISRFKAMVLREHILNEGGQRRRPFVFRPKSHIFACVLEEMEEAGLVEVSREEGVLAATRMTPKGALCYLRSVGRAAGKKSGREYFGEFVKRNPDFLGRCGPIQRARIEKYLVLGFMPPFSKESPRVGS
jgi:hypothetical protein